MTTEILSAFLKRWPLSAVKKMTLGEYVDIDNQDTFTQWVETKTKSLGSIHGMPSHKFGIYKRKAPEKRHEKYTNDSAYSWLKRFGKRRGGAFKQVHNCVVRTIELAKKGDFKSIDEIQLPDLYKWKVAFLYSNQRLVPIFKRSILENIYHHYTGSTRGPVLVSKVQQLMMKYKPSNISVHDFMKQLDKDFHPVGEPSYKPKPKLDAKQTSKSIFKVLDSVKELTDKLVDFPDSRRPGDARRKGTFKKGWADATVRKKRYDRRKLKQITWQNLGYRLGTELGSMEKETIDIVFKHLASSWDGKYFEPTDDEGVLQEKVREYSKHGEIDDEYDGPDNPPARTKRSSAAFKRCPRVKAKILKDAAGFCELCLQVAPFKNLEGELYLEVHHVIPLSKNGYDKTTNAVALCPNCHRRCHHSADANKASNELYSQIKRLVSTFTA